MAFIRNAYAKIRAAYLKDKAIQLLDQAASLQAKAAAMQAEAAALLGEDTPSSAKLAASETKPEKWTPPASCVECHHLRLDRTCGRYGPGSCENEAQRKVLEAEYKEQKRREFEERIERRERDKRNDFIQETYLFLGAHGTRKADIEALLGFMTKRCGFSFNSHNAEWTADANTITGRHSWSAHSFFDDGGGEEGSISISISFVGNDEKGYRIENEKLDDSVRYTSNMRESFYVKDPFGFRGVFKVSGYYHHEFTD